MKYLSDRNEIVRGGGVFWVKCFLFSVLKKKFVRNLYLKTNILQVLVLIISTLLYEVTSVSIL